MIHPLSCRRPVKFSRGPTQFPRPTRCRGPQPNPRTSLKESVDFTAVGRFPVWP
jgi:hypothetical protein